MHYPLRSRNIANIASGLLLSVAIPATLSCQTPAPQTLTVCKSQITVTLTGATPDLPASDILHWVQTSAESVATYYGRFPVPQMSVRVHVAAGEDDISNGTTYGGDRVFTRITVGQHATLRQLHDDWMMTHEFVHTAFPDLDERHHWIEEGLAVYVEPLARVQNGVLPADKVWRDMVRDMPQGEPGFGARGLDHTHDWASTYWGGALFFLTADVQIREQTHNRKSLQDALRAILAAGHNITQDGTPESAFALGDQAVGVAVLVPLYHRVKDDAVTFDLPALWQKLGITTSRTGVTFSDRSPDAEIRRTFFAPRPACSAGR